LKVEHPRSVITSTDHQRRYESAKARGLVAWWNEKNERMAPRRSKKGHLHGALTGQEQRKGNGIKNTQNKIGGE